MKLFKEPIVHFVVLALAVFALFAFVAPPAPPPPDRIVLTAQDGERLRAQFRNSRGRDPDAVEFRSLVDNELREEIFYREALSMGLNDNDQVIRLRMRQKMEFLLADPAAVPAPTEDQLRARYDETKARYTEPETMIYLGSAAPASAEDALAALRAGGDLPPDIGAGLFPPEMADARQALVDSLFGTGFVASLGAVPAGEWTGPLTSPYGLHLVRVSAARPARPLDFAEVRDLVEADWRRAETARASEAEYDRMGTRYRIDLSQLGLAP